MEDDKEEREQDSEAISEKEEGDGGGKEANDINDINDRYDQHDRPEVDDVVKIGIEKDLENEKERFQPTVKEEEEKKDLVEESEKLEGKEDGKDLEKVEVEVERLDQAREEAIREEEHVGKGRARRGSITPKGRGYRSASSSPSLQRRAAGRSKERGSPTLGRGRAKPSRSSFVVDDIVAEKESDCSSFLEESSRSERGSFEGLNFDELKPPTKGVLSKIFTKSSFLKMGVIGLPRSGKSSYIYRFFHCHFNSVTDSTCFFFIILVVG